MIEAPVINYLAVLIAAIASMIVGFLWYGPIFGKTWTAFMGMDPKKMTDEMKKGMMKGYLVAFIAALVMAYVLAHVIAYTLATSIMDAVFAAFWTWLGFIATVLIGIVLWEKRPVKLYLINASYYLVTLIVMAIIIFWMG